MRKKLLHGLVLWTLSICFYASSYSQAGPQKIVIIRHGEKPEKGDNLSCEGLNRAIQLSGVLYNKIGIPNQIYVPSLNVGKNTTIARMYQTIIPFAVKYNLNIDTKYSVKDIDKIATNIKQETGTTLLVWEHKNIVKIVMALGIKEKLTWDDNDYDSIWIITFSNGVPKLSKDKENIKPSSNCQ